MSATLYFRVFQTMLFSGRYEATYTGIDGLFGEKAERLDRSVAEPWTSLTAANKFFFTAAMLLKFFIYQN